MAEMISRLPKGFTPVGEAPVSNNSALPAGFNLVGEPPSALDQIGAGIKGAIAAAATGGQNIYNTARKVLTLPGNILKNEVGLGYIPSLPASKQNFYNTLNVPQYARTGAPGFMEKMIQYSPTLVPSIEGAASPVVANELGIIPAIKAGYKNAVNDLTPRVANVAQQAALGGALSQNPSEGAKTFGLTQGAIEAANPVLRALMLPLHGAANLVNPVGAAKTFGKGLQTIYNTTKDSVSKAYSYMNPYKGELISNPESLIDPELKKYFPLSVKRKANTFLDNPTLDNAHQLQSDMYTTSQKINPNTFDDLDKINALSTSREPLLDAITSKLHEKDPVAALNYNHGRYLNAAQLKPLTPTPFFQNAAEGEIETDDPNQIIREYEKAFPTKSSIPNNYLTSGVEGLNKRIGFGHAAQYGVPMAIGAAIGHAGGGTGLDTLMGAGGGGMFARFEEAPIIKNMLQNKTLHGALGAAGKTARKISRFAVPLIAGQSQNALNNINSKNK